MTRKDTKFSQNASRLRTLILQKRKTGTKFILWRTIIHVHEKSTYLTNVKFFLTETTQKWRTRQHTETRQLDSFEDWRNVRPHFFSQNASHSKSSVEKNCWCWNCRAEVWKRREERLKWRKKRKWPKERSKSSERWDNFHHFSRRFPEALLHFLSSHFLSKRPLHLTLSNFIYTDSNLTLHSSFKL